MCRKFPKLSAFFQIVASHIRHIVTAGMADNIVFMLTEFFDTAKVGLQL